MVDGILTKLRNPFNQDVWLTDRFSTSVNHPLSLSLHQGYDRVFDMNIRSHESNRYALQLLWETDQRIRAAVAADPDAKRGPPMTALFISVPDDMQQGRLLRIFRLLSLLTSGPQSPTGGFSTC